MQVDVWNINGDGFHLGRHGLGQEESGVHVPSDTLFAALVARLADLYGPAAVEAWMQPLQADPPAFVLSSAFPRAGDVRLLPVPLRAPAAENPPGGPRPKDLKRVKYLSEAAFRAVAAGKRIEDDFVAGLKLHQGTVLIALAEVGQLPQVMRDEQALWHVEKRPRVALGRAAQNSQIYFTGRTVFQPGCGLWFAVRWLNRTDERAQTLAALLADLGDAGLGGERSNGFGQCRIQAAGTLELPDPDGGPWVALSRYLPHADETQALSNDGAAYSLETVGGWVNSPSSKSERRRAVWLLAEGAVLGPVVRSVPGQIVDVAPNYGGPSLGHPVWRCGQALAVGVRPAATTARKGEGGA